jgi:serine/threonine-protein kinase
MDGRPGMIGRRYALHGLIDAGGDGEVWHGHDVITDGIVAVKTYRLPAAASDGTVGRRFVAEARILATLSDPAIVELRDIGFDGTSAYVVMPLLNGESLRTLLARVGPLAPAYAMELMVRTAAALDVVHQRGFVHRGVMPSRLFLPADGGLMLTDFGLGRLVHGGRMMPPDATYLSPEEACGDLATVVSDVYSLGAVAYHCLAGRPPFLSGSTLHAALMHVREVPPPLPDWVPPAVREVVGRALIKDPTQRWPSAGAFAAAAHHAVLASQYR